MSGAYLALEVPDDQLIGAIAEEQSVGDAALDGLERAALTADDPLQSAAWALAIGRCGRRESGPVLQSLRAHLVDRKAPEAVQAIELAMDLLPMLPPERLERAERGYRWTPPGAEEAVYIEDPLAAHWHAQGAWGPPLRPNLELPPRLGHEDGIELLAHADRGGVVVVLLRGPSGRPEPALRLCRAGFARDAALHTLVRWSQVEGMGFMDGPAGSRTVALEVDGRIQALPPTRAGSAERLSELMQALARRGRGPEAATP